MDFSRLPMAFYRETQPILDVIIGHGATLTTRPPRRLSLMVLGGILHDEVSANKARGKNVAEVRIESTIVRQPFSHVNCFNSGRKTMQEVQPGIDVPVPP